MCTAVPGFHNIWSYVLHNYSSCPLYPSLWPLGFSFIIWIPFQGFKFIISLIWDVLPSDCPQLAFQFYTPLPVNLYSCSFWLPSVIPFGGAWSGIQAFTHSKHMLCPKPHNFVLNRGNFHLFALAHFIFSLLECKINSITTRMTNFSQCLDCSKCVNNL